jgi:ribosomal protein S6
VRKYEGLFILNIAGREEGLSDIIDRITGELTKLGAKVETVQKMEKKAFTRVANKKVKEGHYINFIFEADPEVAVKLGNHFDLDEDVFRLMLTHAAVTKAA